MLSLIKRIFIFLTFFLVVGLIGVVLDVATGFQYGIRDSLTASVGQARGMTARWIRAAKKSWWWSPVLALSFILSPILFVVALVIALHDLVRADQVYWDDGERTVYPGGPLTEADIYKNPKVVTSWFNFKLGSLLGDDDRTGVLYMGAPIPSGWQPENVLDEDDRRKALDLHWRRIGISGQYWYAPPAGENQNVGLDKYEPEE